MNRFLKLTMAAILAVGVSVPAYAQDGHARRAREMAREQERAREARQREARTRAHVEGARRQGEQAYFARNQSMSAGELRRAAEAAKGLAGAGVVHTGSMSAGTTVSPGTTPGGANGGGGVHSRERTPGT